MTKGNHIKHVGYILLGGLASLVVALILSNLYFEQANPKNIPITFGVTFSPTYTESLELDWKKVYADILDNLGVKYIRIPTYWKEIEPNPGRFSFDSVDYMLEQAGKRQTKVLLVLGIKQPRWPECQPPKWALEYSLKDRQQEILNVMERVVTRYKDNSTIWGWQVENEPLFEFGVHCDPPDRTFLRKEVELVRRLDPGRPIVLTDSGEWRFWVTPMRLSDIFGTTLYKITYSDLLGYYTYPIPPSFYHFKANLIKSLFAPKNQKVIIVELQAEPWSPKSLAETGIGEQLKIFDLENFKGNVEFGRKTGFDEVYLWGVEWWYFMEKKGHPEFLEYAKSLFGTKN